MEKPIGHKINWIETLDSTNEEIARRVNDDQAPEPGELVVAVEQRRGKGMAENRWVSDPGKNLTFSFLIQPDFVKAHQQFYLNMFVSLGVSSCIHEIFPDKPISIKWPNDIYVDQRKIAGILISHAISGDEIVYTIVGIGLNVNQTEFPEDLPNPVSMKQIAGKDFKLPAVLNKLNAALNDAWQSLRNGDLMECRNKYVKSLFAYQRWMKFRYANEVIIARIMGISEFGLLRLEKENGAIHECDLKEVEYVP